VIKVLKAVSVEPYKIHTLKSKYSSYKYYQYIFYFSTILMVKQSKTSASQNEFYIWNVKIQNMVLFRVLWAEVMAIAAWPPLPVASQYFSLLQFQSVRRSKVSIYFPHDSRFTIIKYKTRKFPKFLLKWTD